ncbi:nedd8-activating enzyme E1 regulatory subunit [Glossina fuscipes]|uniref:NEDD8-activating enzyme E1 regulatory subunit n=1 Tax=Glossina fuscipes TaxID=7396 RepID=A0A8U0W8B5_9MUSC|nr:nedd8-activating enzyme E1 regulatory subunit [Glossina fuscipes]KAI9587627.1 hypothetical protein GQX74_003473 [Glossina fuscipes]
MASPTSKSPDQSDKNRKYDRQLRLWGEHGQNMLENANICLINANGLGCEILKGIILPGIGAFTIVDGSKVVEDDLGPNFFLETGSIGKPKATICMQFLQELNTDVKGDSVEESVEYILENRPTFLENFDVVVASNLNEQSLLNLSDFLWRADIPFIYCRSLGMLGSIRIQIREHCVIESHSDNRQNDLRLEHPFPSLKEHLEKTEVTTKVPWLFVLFKYLQKWKAENSNRAPCNYKEKSVLRDMVKAEMSSNEENFEEAIKAVNTAFGGGNVSPELAKIFEDDACENLNKKSKPFWIMMKAMKDFVQNENNGQLPLSGVLPDMTADTNSYINLQNIYRQQALHDADQVYRRCQSLVKELGLQSDTVLERDVRLVCREAAGITIIRGSKIADEYKRNFNSLCAVDDMEFKGTLMEYYIALRTYERFLCECGNIPGEYYVENDTARFKSVASKIFMDGGMSSANLSDDIIHEICHYGGSELHSTSAFIGGCAAQEVIKIITKQYKPIDNTFLFNGITTESISLKL